MRMVGPVFDEVRYGIAISSDDDVLREEVNLALLELLETGALELLEERWFGTLGG